MRTNYVFIDYENVQPDILKLLGEDAFKVIVFVGTNQTKIDFEFANLMQSFGDNARYIKISGNGNNALDFHIAFYIGHIVARDQNTYFHIISKDTGFDPLIDHLKTKKIFVARHGEVNDIFALKEVNEKNVNAILTTAQTMPEKIKIIVANLHTRGTSKPRTIKTLSSTIQSLFKNTLPEKELAVLLNTMQQQGIITITDTKVSYALPK